MKLSLVVMNPGKTQGQSIVVKVNQFVIGRDADCNLRPASAMISKKHCALLVKEGQVSLRDYGSTNGTFLNDKPVQGEVPLAHDDVVKVGPLIFKLAIENTPAISKPTPLPKAQPKTLGSEDDSAAAMLLGMEDGSPITVGETNESDIPSGSTVMDLPAFTPPGGDPAEAGKPAAKKPDDKAKGHDSAQQAAQAILEKLRRGTRR